MDVLLGRWLLFVISFNFLLMELGSFWYPSIRVRGKTICVIIFLCQALFNAGAQNIRHFFKSFVGVSESIWKFNERVGWTEDTLGCCRKILQPANVVKFLFLYNFQHLIYLNNKNHKVLITDFAFISIVFIVSDAQDRYWWK